MRTTAGTTSGGKTSAVRYDQVARALGCQAEYVDDSRDLRAALERALSASGPVVVQVVVDDRANVSPPGLDEFAGMYLAENT